MSNDTFAELRVLAIDPAYKGFGFAVLEGPQRLIDWGIKQTEVKKDAERRVRSFAENLMKHYEPDVIVIEDPNDKGCQLRERGRETLHVVALLAAKRNIRIVRVARLLVRETLGAPNKHEMAKVITARFPELEPRLFPYRKTWMSEDRRTPMFDAVGLALAYFKTTTRKNCERAEA